MTEAFAAYQEALMLNPHLVDAQFFVELQQRHPDLAATIASQALAILQRDYIATHLPILAAKAGKLALFKGDLELAQVDLEFATQQMPTLYRAWMNLASVYSLRGNRSEAKRCYGIAQLLNPLDIEVKERRNEFNDTSDNSRNEQSDLNARQQELAYFGQFSDANIRLSNEYLHNPDTLINNNIVPGRLLPYCTVRYQ
jgi:tetratricopeptide (TPR) repeat protein